MILMDTTENGISSKRFQSFPKMNSSSNPKGFDRVGMTQQLKALPLMGHKVESHVCQTFQTLRPLEVFLVVNFKAPGLVERRTSWPGHPAIKKTMNSSLMSIFDTLTLLSFFGRGKTQTFFR